MKKMKQMTNRLLSVLLCAMMITGLLGVLPGGTLKAEAYDEVPTRKGLMLGTSGLRNPRVPESAEDLWQGDFIRFGTGMSSGLSNEYRVLSIDIGNSSSVEDFKTAEPAILVEAVSVYNMRGTPYDIHLDRKASSWQGSQYKEKFIDYVDYYVYSGNVEEESIAVTQKAGSNGSLQEGDAVNDKLFILSADEYQRMDYGFLDSEGKSEARAGAWRFGREYDYVARPSEYRLLRAVDYDSDKEGKKEYISNSGYFNDYNVEAINNGYTPNPAVAFCILKEKILFIDKAASYKNSEGIKPISDTTSEYAWGLTLLDESQSLTIKDVVAIDTTYLFSYEYEYQDTATKADRLSLMITDKEYSKPNAEIMYYGRIASGVNTEGKVSFTLPSEVDPENVKLYIIAEKVVAGSDHQTSYTDYAATPVELKLKNNAGSNTGNSESSNTSSPPKVSLEDTNDVLSPDYAGRVSVDFNKELVTLNNVSDYEIAYTAINTDKNAVISKIAGNKWEDATGETEIDISWVSKTKDQALIFRFTNGDEVIYDMLPCKVQDKILKAGLAATSSAITIKGASNTPDFSGELVGDADNGYLYFYQFDSKAKTATPVSTSAIEWRKGTNGNWTKESEDSVADYLNTFKKKGATIYFRIASDGKAWPSKEVKFSYKKQANASKITYSTKDATITLKAGQEYQISVNGADWSEWIPIKAAYGENTKKVEISKLYTDLATKTPVSLAAVQSVSGGSISINVRTATNTTKNTIASKIADITLEALAVGTVGKDNEDIQITYVNAADESKGIAVKNTTAYAYEFGVGTESNAPTTWKTVKAGKSTKLAAKDYSSSSVIYVRIAGDTKSYRLPSASVTFKISELTDKTE